MTVKFSLALDESRIGYILIQGRCSRAGRLHGQSADHNVTLFDPQEEDSPICRTRALMGQ